MTWGLFPAPILNFSLAFASFLRSFFFFLVWITRGLIFLLHWISKCLPLASPFFSFLLNNLYYFLPPLLFSGLSTLGFSRPSCILLCIFKGLLEKCECPQATKLRLLFLIQSSPSSWHSLELVPTLLLLGFKVNLNLFFSVIYWGAKKNVYKWTLWSRLLKQ